MNKNSYPLTEIVLLGFWLKLLPWMFIWFYATIYFFVKNILSEWIIVFSEYHIRMFLFIFWLRNRPSIKYVSNSGNEEGVIQNVYRCEQEEGVEKSVINTYVLNGCPKQMLCNFFCALVWASTLENHRQQGKCHCFLPS